MIRPIVSFALSDSTLAHVGMKVSRPFEIAFGTIDRTLNAANRVDVHAGCSCGQSDVNPGGRTVARLGAAGASVHLPKLRKTGTAIPLVEHNVRAALALTHRGYVLNIGKVVTSGTIEDLSKNQRTLRSYLGGMESTPTLVQSLIRQWTEFVFIEPNWLGDATECGAKLSSSAIPKLHVLNEIEDWRSHSRYCR